jgi:hypothetical protein
MGWSNHRDLGHTLALPLLGMLVSAYPGQLPRKMKWLTWLLFAVYVIQADVLIFLRASLPVVSAFHPVLSLVDFALAAFLFYQAWPAMRDAQQQTPAPAVSEQYDRISP